MKELIAFEATSFGYGSHIVLENINLKIYKGDFVLISGENGTGKTTLMKGLLGLLSPISGKIRLNFKAKDEFFAYISQQKTNSLDFPASVYEIVLSGRLKAKEKKTFYDSEDKKIVLESLKALKISEVKNKAFRMLSGGQKQRVLLARALATGSSILVLDEPTTGLDQMTREELYKILDQLNRGKKKTIIMISHDKYSDRNVDIRLLEVRNKGVIEL